MTGVWSDIRFAFRSLRRSPAHTLTVLATLVIGIGAAVAAFSVVNGVLLEPLPLDDPDALVRVGLTPEGEDAFRGVYLNVFDQLVDQARTLDGVAGVQSGRTYLDQEGPPVEVRYVETLGDYFAVVGVRPVLGRFFEPEERLPDGTRPGVISYGFWQESWGGRPAVIGETIRLENQTTDPVVTVVGVAPPVLDGAVPSLPAARLWMPLERSASSLIMRIGNREFFGGTLNVFARLSSGADPGSAEAEMSTLVARAREDTSVLTIPPDPPDDTVPRVTRLSDLAVGSDARRTLLIFAAAVTMVFAIGVMNLVNLQAGRISRRRRELSVRAALGASRWSLLRQLTLEAVLVSSSAAVLALALLAAVQNVALAAIPPLLPRWDNIGVDWRAFLAAVAIALGAGLIIGIIPSLRISRSDVSPLLREGAAGATGTREQRGLNNLLTFAETCLAIVLLVGAGLLIHNFSRLTRVDYGFEPDDVTTIEITFPRRYNDDVAARGFLARSLREELAGLAGVESVVVADGLPGLGVRTGSVELLGLEAADSAESNRVGIPLVGEDYEQVLRIPVVAGRWFDADDIRNGLPVAVVSEVLARRAWGEEANPIGQRLLFRIGDGPNLEIIGVAGDIRESYAEEAQPFLYLPYPGTFLPVLSTGRMILAARTHGPVLKPDVITDMVNRLEPDGLVKVESMNTILGRQVERERFQTALLSSFAGVAVLLSILGVYSVVAFATVARTREVGVRLALGARGSAVVRLMMIRGVVPGLIGVGAGVATARALSGVIRGYVVGIEPTDPWTYGIVAVAGVVLILFAAWLPARRASRVDPMTALRFD